MRDVYYDIYGENGARKYVHMYVGRYIYLSMYVLRTDKILLVFSSYNFFCVGIPATAIVSYKNTVDVIIADGVVQQSTIELSIVNAMGVLHYSRPNRKSKNQCIES